MTGIEDQMASGGVAGLAFGLIYLMILIVKAKLNISDAQRPSVKPDACLPCREKVEEARDGVQRMEVASVLAAQATERQLALLTDIRDGVRDLCHDARAAGRHPFIPPPGNRPGGGGPA